MALFPEHSGVVIHGGEFTAVQGSQSNITYNTHNHYDNRTGTFQTASVPEKKVRTIWDNYNWVRTGNIKVVKDVITDDHYDSHEGPSSWSQTMARDTRRIISIVRIDGKDKGSKYLCVRYSGLKALQAFKQDFDQFSSSIAVKRRLNFAQLFGYDDRCDIPALIFHDALVPLNRVLLENPGNPWIQLYLCLQVAMVVERDKHSVFANPDSLWIEPRSGVLQKGPYVPSHSNCYICPLYDAPPISHDLTKLSIRSYSDINTLMDYLVRTLPLGTIFDQFQVNYKTVHWVYRNASELWVYLASSIFKWNQQHIVAQWSELMEAPRYVCVYKYHNCNHSANVSWEQLKNGSLRIQFGTDFTGSISFWLEYQLFHGSEPLDTKSVWLAQAHSIFSQLGIHEDEWDQYVIISGFELKFDPIKVHTNWEEITVQRYPDWEFGRRNLRSTKKKFTLYLFVRPIPRLSDDETKWKSWAQSMYFWSDDPSGQKEMSESMRVSLGIPSFEIKTKFHLINPELETYRVMEKVHHSKGFDPKTTDFACSLGYPLIQLVGDENRFQELGESNDDCSMSVDVAVSCPNAIRHDNVSNDTPVNKVPDTEIDEMTVDNKSESKVAGKRRKVHTDSDNIRKNPLS